MIVWQANITKMIFLMRFAAIVRMRSIALLEMGRKFFYAKRKSRSAAQTLK